MVFHYRGAWGSEGTFSFEHVLEDCSAGLAHLRSEAMVQACRIDPGRVALVGHSMGRWAALMLAAQGSVLGAASIAGYNVGAAGGAARQDPQELEDLVELFEPGMGPLGGADARSLFGEAVRHAEGFDVRSHADALASQPILLAIATHDPAVPKQVHHLPLVDALRRAGAERLTLLTVETDHAFSDRRVELARATIDWLASLS